MAVRKYDHLQTACLKLIGDGKDPYLGCATPGQIDDRDRCLVGLVSRRLLSQVGDGYQLTQSGRAALMPDALATGIFETPETGEEHETTQGDPYPLSEGREDFGDSARG